MFERWGGLQFLTVGLFGDIPVPNPIFGSNVPGGSGWYGVGLLLVCCKVPVSLEWSAAIDSVVCLVGSSRSDIDIVHENTEPHPMNRVLPYYCINVGPVFRSLRVKIPVVYDINSSFAGTVTLRMGLGEKVKESRLSRRDSLPHDLVIVKAV